MDELLWETPQEINLALAKRISVIRKRKKITQQQLSSLSGVSLGSIKRFERTGDISLNHLFPSLYNGTMKQPEPHRHVPL